MADSSSSQDVEQVLSSIRRLVGERDVSVPRDKLILTPALRVMAPGSSPDSRGGGNASGLRRTNGHSASCAVQSENGAVSGSGGAFFRSETPGASLERRITELENVIARSDATWVSEAEDMAGRLMHGAVRPISKTSGGLATKPPAPEADDLPETGEEGAALDTRDLREEELRRLVTDVVREELQGALGERITRNVRKLIRSEIRRVLAEANLDKE